MKVELRQIYPDHLYAVFFDGKDLNEYEMAFKLWDDEEYLVKYFEDNKKLLNTDYWRSKLQSLHPVFLAKSIRDESHELIAYIKDIAWNTSNDYIPDFDSFFEPLRDSRYAHLTEYIPQKSYGTSNPSMLQLYALRIDTNCYIVIYGGIKLTHKIEETPLLNKELFPKIDYVIQYLKANGISDTDDFLE